LLRTAFAGIFASEIADVSTVRVQREVGRCAKEGVGLRIGAAVAHQNLRIAQLVGGNDEVRPRTFGSGGVLSATRESVNFPREFILVIVGENAEGNAYLFEVARAIDASRLGFGLG